MISILSAWLQTPGFNYGIVPLKCMVLVATGKHVNPLALTVKTTHGLASFNLYSVPFFHWCNSGFCPIVSVFSLIFILLSLAQCLSASVSSKEFFFKFNSLAHSCRCLISSLGVGPKNWHLKRSYHSFFCRIFKMDHQFEKTFQRSCSSLIIIWNDGFISKFCIPKLILLKF